MQEYNWASFKKRVNIKAGIAEVYAMWAKPSGLEKWFLRLAEFKRPDGKTVNTDDSIKSGDTYRWLWFGWPDSMEEKGDLLEANGTDLIKFTFGNREVENMTCTVKIYTEQGETICELTQENIPVDEKGKCNYHLGCMNGWTFFMANLKSILENGYDLRNRNEELKHVITA